MSEEKVQSRHTEMEELLKFGIMLGFEVYCPDSNKSHYMKKNCVSFTLDVPSSERVKLIDVLWIKNNNIEFAWEVENSTSITSALECGAHLENKEIQKIIVLPSSRKNYLEKKKKEPLFNDYYTQYNWKEIFYEDIIKLSQDRSLTLMDFLKKIN